MPPTSAPVSPRHELPHCCVVLAPLLAVLATAPPARGHQLRGALISFLAPASPSFSLIPHPLHRQPRTSQARPLPHVGQILHILPTKTKSPAPEPPPPNQRRPRPLLVAGHGLHGRGLRIPRPPSPPHLQDPPSGNLSPPAAISINRPHKWTREPVADDVVYELVAEEQPQQVIQQEDQEPQGVLEQQPEAGEPFEPAPFEFAYDQGYEEQNPQQQPFEEDGEAVNDAALADFPEDLPYF